LAYLLDLNLGSSSTLALSPRNLRRLKVMETDEMRGGRPVACSLGTGELEQRVAAIAEIGAAGLASRSVAGGSHLLRFHGDTQTKRRLEEIVAAESECCPFLELSLTEEDGELVLSIAAPAGGEETAAALAEAFGPPGGHR
jgi:MerR family transcriptional regulator, copper efflux regulator